MKIQTKYDIGDKVLTPLNSRLGRIGKILIYSSNYHLYNVEITVPLLNENAFRTYYIDFDEKDLVKP